MSVSLLTACGTVSNYRIGPDVLIYDDDRLLTLTSIFAEADTLMGPGSKRMVTQRSRAEIDLEFVKTLFVTDGPERYDYGRLGTVVTAYKGRGHPPTDGTPWLVSVQPLVLAHGPKMFMTQRRDEVTHLSNLLYPLVTEFRLELPITHIVVLDERAWEIAGNYDLDDDYRIADVRRRVLELSPPMTLRKVLEKPPWLAEAAHPTTLPSSAPSTQP